MKYAVNTSLEFDLPAKRNKWASDLQVELDNKSIWGESIVNSGTALNRNLQYGLTIRFNTEADMLRIFNFIKQKIDAIPVLTGSVSRHYCAHDEDNRPCVIAEEYRR